MGDERETSLTAGGGGLDPATHDNIHQLFVRAWRRVQQRTGRAWDKKRERWLQLLGADGAPVTSNQARVALNNLVSFAQLPAPEAAMLRQAIHDDYQSILALALRSLGDAHAG
jgi:hypothetical protein